MHTFIHTYIHTYIQGIKPFDDEEELKDAYLHIYIHTYIQGIKPFDDEEKQKGPFHSRPSVVTWCVSNEASKRCKIHTPTFTHT